MLNGTERPVAFGIKEQGDKKAEIVHSLAKWKRMALKQYGFNVGEGLYADMNAIRREECTDNIHSIYVDQWDWEKIISEEERTKENLEQIVNNVYKALKVTEDYMAYEYDYIGRVLPDHIKCITSQELEDKYPECTPKEREYKIAKLCGAVFIEQIGDILKSGERHDGRAPDYDDWKLNGDILVYYPVLDIALELSSMGIRVDEKALKEQLTKSGCEIRTKLSFQKFRLLFGPMKLEQKPKNMILSYYNCFIWMRRKASTRLQMYTKFHPSDTLTLFVLYFPYVLSGQATGNNSLCRCDDGFSIALILEISTPAWNLKAVWLAKECCILSVAREILMTMHVLNPSTQYCRKKKFLQGRS